MISSVNEHVYCRQTTKCRANEINDFYSNLFCVAQENTPSQEDVLREHVNELRDKLRTLHSQQEGEIQHYRAREEASRKTMLALQDKHKQEVGASFILWWSSCIHVMLYFT